MSESVGENKELNECHVVKRDPHHENLICIGIEKGFYQVDLRAPDVKASSLLKQNMAHSDLLMDLDYNPIKFNTIATCG